VVIDEDLSIDLPATQSLRKAGAANPGARQ